MHEPAGRLRQAVRTYLAGGAMTPGEVAVIRVYLRQWISGPWQGKNLNTLRLTVGAIQTRRDIERWLGLAMHDGIDPL